MEWTIVAPKNPELFNTDLTISWKVLLDNGSVETPSSFVALRKIDKYFAEFFQRRISSLSSGENCNCQRFSSESMP